MFSHNLVLFRLIPEQFTVKAGPTQLYLGERGRRGSREKGGTIIPVYNLHTHSKRQKTNKNALKRQHFEGSVGAHGQKYIKMQKK